MLKLIEIRVLWVYNTISFGLRLFQRILAVTFQLFKLHVQAFGRIRKTKMYFAMTGLNHEQMPDYMVSKFCIKTFKNLHQHSFPFFFNKRKMRRWKYACSWGSLEKLGVVPKVYLKGSLKHFSSDERDCIKVIKVNWVHQTYFVRELWYLTENVLFTRFLYQRCEPKTRRR